MVRTEHSPLEGGLSRGVEFKASIVVLSFTQSHEKQAQQALP